MKVEDIERDKKANEVKMESFTLGTIICRFTIPQFVIDEINTAYDEVWMADNLSTQRYPVTVVIYDSSPSLLQDPCSTIEEIYLNNGMFLLQLSKLLDYNL